MTRFESVEQAATFARTRLKRTYLRLFPEHDVNAIDAALEGQLLRPVLSLVGCDASQRTDERFWFAALAVQLAHAASLLHDDVVDAATTRRGAPTVAAKHGAAAAVLAGDTLLTAAYVAAAHTESAAFVLSFAQAVERTVAAERAQGVRLGQSVDAETYIAIATGKAGALMGCAVAAAALVGGGSAMPMVEVGAQIGLVYQMMDDLLDYCPSATTGKNALGDYGQGRWTWPLDLVPNAKLGCDPTDMLAAFHADTWSDAPGERGASSPLVRAADLLEARIDSLALDARTLFGDNPLMTALLGGWRHKISRTVRSARAARVVLTRDALASRYAAVGASQGSEGQYLARNSRSFRFASRILPRADSDRIARVYAFCRFTDDIVDEPVSGPATREELLDRWIGLARESYTVGRCDDSGFESLNITMGEMRAAGVDFTHVEELGRGMRMDLGATRYATLADLRVYTHRVAGVVGLWIAQLAGVRDAEALAKAELMGHAMQLSNLLRDVGEDWQRGRLYLPLEAMNSYRLEPDDIGRMVSGQQAVSGAYRAMIRELVEMADSEYRSAFTSLPALPVALQPGMAVAAGVYAGIHDALRRNDYDNIHVRARTSPVRKVAIAALSLRALRRTRAASRVAGGVREDLTPATAGVISAFRSV